MPIKIESERFSFSLTIMIAEVGSHISACRAKEKQSEPELIIATLRTRAAALQASKKYEQAGRALDQWVVSYFVHKSAPSWTWSTWEICSKSSSGRRRRGSTPASSSSSTSSSSPSSSSPSSSSSVALCPEAGTESRIRFSQERNNMDPSQLDSFLSEFQFLELLCFY